MKPKSVNLVSREHVCVKKFEVKKVATINSGFATNCKLIKGRVCTLYFFMHPRRPMHDTLNMLVLNKQPLNLSMSFYKNAMCP